MTPEQWAQFKAFTNGVIICMVYDVAAQDNFKPPRISKESDYEFQDKSA